ncbi:hypothetical protein A2U01_0115321, partial [Trifolium medium]|nr:hypothetical protein [Trifolium medium]
MGLWFQQRIAQMVAFECRGSGFPPPDCEFRSKEGKSVLVTSVS